MEHLSSAQLVTEFIEEMLSGEIRNFKTFDLKRLRFNEKYGSPGRPFDCDDTELMRGIYILLWGDIFPGMHQNNFGFLKQYRGDTVNSFHTMFGRPIPERPGFFNGVEKYAPSDELREQVRIFSNCCNLLGNYVVLPNLSACRTTLNCYRGTNEWRDFFDRFLIELYKVQTGSEGQDETLKKLIRVNDFCFSCFTGETGMAQWIERLFLQDYCYDNAPRPQEIFPINYHWKNLNDREKYFQDARHYIETSCRIINNRTEKMISLLKTRLNF
jgi:hypothetical protein